MKDLRWISLIGGLVLFFAHTTASFTCRSLRDGFYPDPISCKGYYRCVYGSPHSFSCGPRTYFSVERSVCDWIRNVNCVNGVRPGLPNTQPPIRTIPTNRPTTRTTTWVIPSLLTRTLVRTTTKPVPAEVSCVGRANGAMFPDPRHCASYYWCVNGQLHHLTCGDNLVFNEEHSTCDWTYNVDCSRRTSAVTQRPTWTNPIRTTRRPVWPTWGPWSTVSPSVAPEPCTTNPTTTGGVATRPTGTPVSKGCGHRVCYYTNWAQYRTGQGKFIPSNIDPFLCTHLIYAFAKLNGNNLANFEWNDDQRYIEFNALKQINPQLKTLLAVGGWNMGSAPFTSLVETAQNRQAFADHALSFLKSRGFDGLDLDWEYPANRGSPPQDRDRFSLLVKQLRQTFDHDAAVHGGQAMLLTAAVGAGKTVIDSAYDIQEIAKHLDFIGLMSYDLHGSWETKAGHHSALYPRPDETGDDRFLNVDYAAKYWESKGCPKNKLVVGIPTYARTFTLQSASQSYVGAPISGPGPRGALTGVAGFLAYSEVCQTIKAGGMKGYIESQRVPYVVKDNAWIGYEDVDSVKQKVRFAKNNGYAGVMTWALPLDDFKGQSCGEGPFPLLSAIKDECQK